MSQSVSLFLFPLDSFRLFFHLSVLEEQLERNCLVKRGDARWRQRRRNRNPAVAVSPCAVSPCAEALGADPTGPTSRPPTIRPPLGRGDGGRRATADAIADAIAAGVGRPFGVCVVAVDYFYYGRVIGTGSVGVDGSGRRRRQNAKIRHNHGRVDVISQKHVPHRFSTVRECASAWMRACASARVREKGSICETGTE